MLSPGNVATPATAATVVVPERVPLPGFAPSATVTLPVKPVAVFPCPSSAVTCTAGVMDAPAAVLLGCVVTAGWLRVPEGRWTARLARPALRVRSPGAGRPLPLCLFFGPGTVARPPAAAQAP